MTNHARALLPSSAPVEVICLDSSKDLMYSVWEKEELLPETIQFLASLPLDVHPSATAQDYAHVLNVLAAHWRCREEFVRAISSYVRSPEWPREGFPRLVFFEILQLAAYHGSLPDLGVLDMSKLNLRPGS